MHPISKLLLFGFSIFFHSCRTQNFDIVLLPLWNTYNENKVNLNFSVFGKTVELNLHRNDDIVSQNFEIRRHNEDGTTTELPDLNRPNHCHYLHKNEFGTAAVSLCHPRGMHGLLFFDDIMLEINPLWDHNPLISVDENQFMKRSWIHYEKPHVIKRSTVNDFESKIGVKNLISNVKKLEEAKINIDRANDFMTLELALFFDQPAYDLFLPFLGSDEKIQDMLLAYVNAVQALYHHPSLGGRIDLSLVRLEIMSRQPRDLPHHNGERGMLLESFCRYASNHNQLDDNHPNHWDLGLYVSGLDFYVMENNHKSTATMGLAVVGGVCTADYSCVIAELGVNNIFGKPYPSAGFTSVYIAAHEIGHNLGMHHDSVGNSCQKEGYIMSPSRGIRGETIWSHCSRNVVLTLSHDKSCLLDKTTKEIHQSIDHNRYLDLPGRQWNAKRQCEFLLRDPDAVHVTLTGACESLQCKTPHRNGYYYSGPALDGTICAPEHECRGGSCLPLLHFLNENQQSNKQPEKGSWSEWQVGPCKSSCLEKSIGAMNKRRFCMFGKNSADNCEGLRYDVVICKDEKLCKKKRKSAIDYSNERCASFAKKLPELEASGLQAPHEVSRPWLACAIFCKRRDMVAYYAPRAELNDLGLDPYFPDGTWCHREKDEEYYCRQRHCLPKNLNFDGTNVKGLMNTDDELGAQNARPRDFEINDETFQYLSLDSNGMPLLTRKLKNSTREIDDWVDKDYIEMNDLNVIEE